MAVVPAPCAKSWMWTSLTAAECSVLQERSSSSLLASASYRIPKWPARCWWGSACRRQFEPVRAQGLTSDMGREEGKPLTKEVGEKALEVFPERRWNGAPDGRVPVGEPLWWSAPVYETHGVERRALAPSGLWRGVWQTMAIQVTTAITAGALLVLAPPVHATDALKTCACLLKECRVELARCIADPLCAANVACLQSCNNRPDETECQIGCGDLFENKVVDQFNDCAVSRKGCVPQKADEGLYPVPAPAALVPNFNIVNFSGDWYISAGLNPTFDTFDCQLHKFSATPEQITANLSWRITTPDGGFFTRTALQTFVQDAKQPGVLYNHDNEFLHYQDDWYILSASTKNQPDDHIFVYYRGQNDAWDGYGGAVVYTRSRVLPESIVPDLTVAAKKVGLDFSEFRRTDNTCGPEPPLLARLEKSLEKGEKALEQTLVSGEQAVLKEAEVIEEAVENLGKKELSPLLASIGKGFEELKKDEELFLKGLGEEEKVILDTLQMEVKQIEDLFSKALPIRKVR